MDPALVLSFYCLESRRAESWVHYSSFSIQLIFLQSLKNMASQFIYTLTTRRYIFTSFWQKSRPYWIHQNSASRMCSNGVTADVSSSRELKQSLSLLIELVYWVLISPSKSMEWTSGQWALYVILVLYWTIASTWSRISPAFPDPATITFAGSVRFVAASTRNPPRPSQWHWSCLDLTTAMSYWPAYRRQLCCRLPESFILPRE